MSDDVLELLGDWINWAAWARMVEERGIEIDRPAGTAHPVYPSIIYPIDYGFIPDTVSTDGEPVDVFKGSTDIGLCAAILTTDHRRGGRELKLIYDCGPVEIYLVNGFINFDRSLMEGELVLRRPMRELWEEVSSK